MTGSNTTGRITSRARLVSPARERYWRTLENLFAELGYRDYLGARQRYRDEHLREVQLLSMFTFLIDYLFGDRLFQAAPKVLKWLRSFGSTVILSDNDVVSQRRKIEHAGLSAAVDGRVLIYIDKEEALDDVERRYPAEHYVVIDDKLQILAAVKQFWGARATTIFARQGIYAPETIVRAFPPADVTVEHIGDLLDYDLPRVCSSAQAQASRLEATR
jgi:FMN phosphatase YigB (HAD superfamily)